ncbi:MAG: ATP-dependent helicase/nuclease subunit A, partial [Mariniblastus sp.]
NFQALFAADKQRNVREAMCVLYVALTRAVHATHIVMSYGAKPDHKSPAGILLSTLCPGQVREEGLLLERGEADWYRKVEQPSELDNHQLDAFYLPEKIELVEGQISPELRSRRGVTRRSPSELEGGSEFRLGSIFESHDNHESRTRGSLIHGCFELVGWLDEAIPSKEQLESHLRTIEPTLDNFDLIIAEFYEMIKQDNIKKLLSRSAYQESHLLDFAIPNEIMLEANRLEVHNERRFAVSLESGLMEGIIDRLILVYQGNTIVAADVIDYKTDFVDESNFQRLIEFYRPQVESYRMAVSKFAGISSNQIATRLVFPGVGNVINLNLIESVVDSKTEGSKAGSGRPKSKSSVSSKKPKRPKMRTKPRAPEPKSKQVEKPGEEQQKTLWD